MAYSDAIGSISGITVLNHCVNTKEPVRQQQGAAEKSKEGRNFVHMYIYEELPHTKNIFNEVISIHT